MIYILLLIIIVIFIYYKTYISNENTVEDVALNESLNYNPEVLPDGKSIIEIMIVDGVPSLTSGPGDDFSNRGNTVFEFIKKTIETYNFKGSRRLIIGVEDTYVNGLGIMVFSKNKKSQKNTMIPDLYAMGEYHGSLNSIDEKQLSEKHTMGIFAGASTGHTDPKYNERILFSNSAIGNSHVKSYITSIVQMEESKIEGNFPSYRDFTSDSISENEQKNYKYVISIDGNTTSWDRIPWVFRSNSILLKKRSDDVNWYYSFMKEDEHYLGFDDLQEAEHVIKNTSLGFLEKINENSKKFVNSYLTLEKQMYYMIKVIELLR